MGLAVISNAEPYKNRSESDNFQMDQEPDVVQYNTCANIFKTKNVAQICHNF
jgi:hypothetical protein